MPETRIPTVGQAASAVDSYNRLLVNDPDLARRSYDALRTASVAEQLVIHGRLLCNVLRPQFLSEQSAERLATISSTIAGIFERAGTVLLSDTNLLELVGTTEQEVDLWQVDPGFPGFTVTSRLDSFITDDIPHFVEYNAESPASIGFNDVLATVFSGLPVMREWGRGLSLRPFRARQALLDLLLWAHRQRGETGTPSIAVIDWDNVLTKRDFEICAEFFVASGVPTVICDPRRLEYRGGKLYHGSDEITMVYRRVLLHELLERSDEAGDLLRAYRDGAVGMLNSPRSKLLHKKSVMALLSAGRLNLDLTEDEQAWIDQTVPWTRLVTNERTTYEGGEVDLLTFAANHRERLVLKPSDEYGGKGVILGWETGQEEWTRALEGAVDEEFVLQERVPVPHADFPTWQNDRVAMVSLLVDTDPLLFRGEMAGILTRISGSALLNVTAGTGSTAATFVLGEETEG